MSAGNCCRPNGAPGSHRVRAAGLWNTSGMGPGRLPVADHGDADRGDTQALQQRRQVQWRLAFPGRHRSAEPEVTGDCWALSLSYMLRIIEQAWQSAREPIAHGMWARTPKTGPITPPLLESSEQTNRRPAWRSARDHLQR